MPELPEVETIVRTIRPKLVGLTIDGVEMLDPLVVRMPDLREFLDGLIGGRVESVTRRGKHIIFEILDRPSMLIHLGMTGQLFVGSATDAPDYARVKFHLTDGSVLWYCDLRKFGRLCLTDDAGRFLCDLGPEPFDADLDPGKFHALLAGRRKPIKSLLLDQSIIAGLGNIYADEALFTAHIHPSTSASSLSEDAAERLLAAIREVLAKGITNRGTTISDYVDGEGRTGHNQASLQAYGRAGQPCIRCGTVMEKARLAGRSTCYCPACQPAPDAA